MPVVKVTGPPAVGAKLTGPPYASTSSELPRSLTAPVNVVSSATVPPATL